MQYNRILVALDQNSRNTAVIQHAARLAERQPASLMAYHCLEENTVAEMEGRIGILTEISMEHSQRVFDRFRTKEHENAAAWLESVARDFREKGITVEVRLDTGDPGKQICKTASLWGAELIVLGQSDRGALAECILGSVSNYVAHNAPCSILLVKHS